MSNNELTFKHLVLSGGGLLGISYIGLLKYLEEKKYVNKIKTITGCSIGALFGALLCVGYNSLELENIFKDLNFKDYLNINADSIINFTKLKGFESGKNIIELIKKCLKNKTDNENITFNQLYLKYDIKLLIGVSNLTTSQFELLGDHNMPDLPIYQAINASIAIPFIFEPVIINNDVYCDGGLLDNLPMDKIIKLLKTLNIISSPNALQEQADKRLSSEVSNNTNNDHTDSSIELLGVYLLNKFNILTASNYQILSLSHYFNAIMRSISSNYILKFNSNKEENIYKIIIFEIPCDIMTFLNLNATTEDIDNIINIAYTITTQKLSD